jgi:exopolysaccharide biosynthesis protein
MKKISVFICVNLWLIFFCFSISAQDFKTVKSGIEYAEMTREIDKQPVKMNLLRLDLSKVRLDVVHAMDAAIGTETTSSIATRHGAFAAINAGFFRLDKSIFAGDAVSVLMIDGQLFSESYARRIQLNIANGKNKTEVGFSRTNVIPSLQVGNQEWEISGINRERKTDELIVFTPEFNRKTLTDNNGLEIIVEAGKVVWVGDKEGNHFIHSNGFILSASGKARENLLGKVKVGDTIRKGTRLFPVKLDGESEYAKMFPNTEDIIGGVPQLIKNGKIEITWEQEKSSKSFVETKHPRTAVAKLKDGKFLMVTVDGRSEESGGIGLQNLAEILLELGAIDAMNLDGGGSTTMFLNGKVVNHPSDKEGERKVGDAILVTPRKK